MTEKGIAAINQRYAPTIVQLKDVEKAQIFENKLDHKLSSSIDYPKFSLGFQHFYHQSKDKMELTQQFKGKKKVYYVLYEFNDKIDDFKNDLDGMSKMYFKTTVVNRDFYKLWEILFRFDLMDDNKSLTSAHISDDGGFAQCTSFYREKFSSNTKDTYYVLETDYNKKVSKSILKGKIQKTTVAKLKNIDLITASGKYKTKNIKEQNVEEQKTFHILLHQIVIALKAQKKGGNFILRAAENYTETTAKLITALGIFYNSVFIVKPLTSRPSDSERFIVCLGYKPNDKHYKILEKLADTVLKKKNDNIVSLFPDFDMDTVKKDIIKANTQIANEQFKNVNKIVQFIQKQNYRGDQYGQYRKNQIEATTYWLSKFYPDKKAYPKQKKEMTDLTKSMVQ